MPNDQVEYIQTVQQEVSRQGKSIHFTLPINIHHDFFVFPKNLLILDDLESKLSKWKDMSMYNMEMYWCYQMLYRDWRGDIPHAGEVDDFTEEDFLTS